MIVSHGAVGGLQAGWYHRPEIEFIDKTCLVHFFYPVTCACLVVGVGGILSVEEVEDLNNLLVGKSLHN